MSHFCKRSLSRGEFKISRNFLCNVSALGSLLQDFSNSASHRLMLPKQFEVTKVDIFEMPRIMKNVGGLFIFS